MRTAPGSRSVLRRERGAAAMIAAIGMVFLAVVALSFVSLAQLETKIGVNHAQEVRAVQAAEAGARRVFREIYDGGGSGTSWLTKTQPIHNDVAVDASGSARYTIRVIDNNDGDGNLNADADNLVIIESTGRAGTPGAEHRVALIVNPSGGATDAVRVPNNLTISGNPTILGKCGSVHVPVSPGYSGGLNLETAGNPVIAQGASTSGTSVAGDYYKSDTATGSQVPPETGVQARPAPTINPAVFAKYADYLLADDGFAYLYVGGPFYVNPGTLSHCTTTPCPPKNPGGWLRHASKLTEPNKSTKETGQCSFGWKMVSEVSSSGPVVWENCGPGGGGYETPGTFYVMGDAVISNNPGTAANPLKITIIATASIMISGTPYLTWDQLTTTTVPLSLNPSQPTNIMLVAGRDLKLNGNADQTFEGAFLAHEQLDISGNPSINGFFMAENANAGVSSWATGDDLLVESNISGNPTITYNCISVADLGGSPIIAGWMAL